MLKEQKDFSDKEILKMKKEAINKVNEMKKKAVNNTKNLNIQDLRKNIYDKNKINNILNNKQVKLDKNHIFNRKFDKDSLLIVILISILVSEKYEDKIIILALMYILLDFKC